MNNLTLKEQRQFRAEQKKKMRQCTETARGHGINKHTAEACDNYSVKCTDCPFGSPPVMAGWTTGDVQKIMQAIKEHRDE